MSEMSEMSEQSERIERNERIERSERIERNEWVFAKWLNKRAMLRDEVEYKKGDLSEWDGSKY